MQIKFGFSFDILPSNSLEVRKFRKNCSSKNCSKGGNKKFLFYTFLHWFLSLTKKFLIAVICSVILVVLDSFETGCRKVPINSLKMFNRTLEISKKLEK